MGAHKQSLPENEDAPAAQPFVYVIDRRSDLDHLIRNGMDDVDRHKNEHHLLRLLANNLTKNRSPYLVHWKQVERERMVDFYGICLSNDSSSKLCGLLKAVCQKIRLESKLINSYETEPMDFPEICKRAIIEDYINRQKVPSLVKRLFIFLAIGTVVSTGYFFQHKYNLFTHHSWWFFAALIAELICWKSDRR